MSQPLRGHSEQVGFPSPCNGHYPELLKQSRDMKEFSILKDYADALWRMDHEGMGITNRLTRHMGITNRLTIPYMG